MNMVSRTAAGIEGLALHVRDAVAGAPVKHMDETGIRVRGRLVWLHVACTGLLSHFRVGIGRGNGPPSPARRPRREPVGGKAPAGLSTCTCSNTCEILSGGGPVPGLSIYHT